MALRYPINLELYHSWVLILALLVSSSPCFAGKKSLPEICSTQLVVINGPTAPIKHSLNIKSLRRDRTKYISGWDPSRTFNYTIEPRDFVHSEQNQSGGRTNVTITDNNGTPYFNLNTNRTAKVFPSTEGYAIISENVATENSRLIKSPRDGVQINTDTAGVEIQGKVLSGSKNLDILLIDETRGADLRRMSVEHFGGMAPKAYFPKLRLGIRTKSKVTSVPLKGWGEILSKLEQGYGGALFMSRLGLDAQFSDDGRYLAINLNLSAHRSQSAIAPSHPDVPASIHQDLNHNGVGLWDTTSNELIYWLTSRDLDTEADTERTVKSPFPVEMINDRVGWQPISYRAFSMRFTQSGELVVARAQLQNFDLEKADIYLKVVKILGNEVSPIYEANAGKFNALFAGDLQGGIEKLLIAEDGRSVAIQTLRHQGNRNWRLTHLPDWRWTGPAK